MEQIEPHDSEKMVLENLIFDPEPKYRFFDENFESLFQSENLDENKKFENKTVAFNEDDKISDKKVDKSTNTAEIEFTTSKYMVEEKDNYSTNESFDSEDSFSEYKNVKFSENNYFLNENKNVEISKIGENSAPNSSEKAQKSENTSSQRNSNFEEKVKITLDFDDESSNEEKKQDEDFMKTEFCLERNWGVYDQRRIPGSQEFAQEEGDMEEKENGLDFDMFEKKKKHGRRMPLQKRRYRLRRSQRIRNKTKRRRGSSWGVKELQRY